jgi:hypothetical protein
MSHYITFSDLERLNGQDYSPKTEDKWPLEEWYDSVRNIPLSDLPSGDLAKACRQGIWIHSVVPVAIERLKVDPLAGDLYEGELIVALKSIPFGFWAEHKSTASEMRHLLERALPYLDTDVQKDASDLLQNIREI